MVYDGFCLEHILDHWCVIWLTKRWLGPAGWRWGPDVGARSWFWGYAMYLQ